MPISISGDPGRPDRLVHTIRDVGGVTRALCAAAPGDVLGVRGPFGRGWQVADGAGGDVVSSPAASGWRRCGPPSSRSLADRAGLRPGERPLRRPDRRTTCSSPPSWPLGADAGIDVARHRRPGSRGWPGQVGLVTELVPRAPLRPGPDAGAGLRPRGDDALRRGGARRERACRRTGSGCPWSGTCSCGVGLCGHCQLREYLLCVDGPVLSRSTGSRAAARLDGSCGWTTHERTARPKLAVWKFASCDGCQLTLLNCEDELLALAGEVEIAYFPEATRAVVDGPYDLSLVEGSVTTAEDAERIQQIRRSSRRLVTIGACATAGGIQALRNFADVAEFRRDRLRPPGVRRDAGTLHPDRRPRPGRLRAARLPDRQARSCSRSSRRSCSGRRPRISGESVCMECKRRGNVCVTVAHGTPCLGPVTHAGCGALCPSYDRGCYGCFGPAGHHEHAVAEPTAQRARDARADDRTGSSARSTPHRPQFAAESSRHPTEPDATQ